MFHGFSGHNLHGSPYQTRDNGYISAHRFFLLLVATCRHASNSTCRQPCHDPDTPFLGSWRPLLWSSL